MGRPCFALSVLMVMLASSLLAVGTANAQVVIAVFDLDESSGSQATEAPSPEGPGTSVKASGGADDDYRSYLDVPGQSSIDTARGEADEAATEAAEGPRKSAAFDSTESWDYDWADLSSLQLYPQRLPSQRPHVVVEQRSAHDRTYDEIVYGPAAATTPVATANPATSEQEAAAGPCWAESSLPCCPYAYGCYEQQRDVAVPASTPVAAESNPPAGRNVRWWYSVIQQADRCAAAASSVAWLHQVEAITASWIEQVAGDGNPFEIEPTVPVARETVAEPLVAETANAADVTTPSYSTEAMSELPHEMLHQAADALEEAGDSLQRLSSYVRGLAH